MQMKRKEARLATILEIAGSEKKRGGFPRWSFKGGREKPATDYHQ